MRARVIKIGNSLGCYFNTAEIICILIWHTFHLRGTGKAVPFLKGLRRSNILLFHRHSVIASRPHSEPCES